MDFLIFFMWDVVAIYLFGFLTSILGNRINDQLSFKNSKKVFVISVEHQHLWLFK